MGGGTNAGRGGPSTAALEAAGLVSTSEDDDDYNPDAPGEADHEGSPAPSSPGHSGGGGVGRGAAGEVGSGGAAEGGGKRRRLSMWVVVGGGGKGWRGHGVGLCM